MNLWKRTRQLRWHQWARIIALMILLDQTKFIPGEALAPSEGIILACIAALFAPVPVEKKE